MEPDSVQRGDDHRLALVPGAAQVMDLQALGNDLADREARAERAIGILEDDLHGAAQRPQVLVAEALDGLAVEADGALGRQQATEGEGTEERRVGKERGSTGRSRWAPVS